MARPRSNGETWRRLLAFGVSSIALLAALIALRGPDAIGLGTAQAVGAWRLTDFALWNPLAPFGALAGFPFTLWGLGMRGWQNAHVIVAWATILCWLWPLPAKSWTGLTPLIPALLAVSLSDPQSGLSAFGFSVLILSAWRLLNLEDPERSWLTLPLAAWLAAWFSAGSIPVSAALAAESFSRWPRARAAATVALGAIAVNFTPRGASVWDEARIFLAWSPQPVLATPAFVALAASLIMLVIALRACLRCGPRGPALAASLLFLAAAWGQTGYLWTAALMMIPVWRCAEESARTAGFNIRWWARTALLVAAGLLVVPAGTSALPRWYDLAMAPSMVRPTLTRDALPKSGPIYINPDGRAIARFGGSLMPRVVDAGASARLPREPALWRENDRKVRHMAVWLLGDPANYAPLARHLGGSPDWRLAAVDATGLLFLRAPREAEFANEQAIQFAREQGAAANRANFMASAALACLAANAVPEAEEFARLAVRQSRDSTRAASARARALIATGDIMGALEESARAIGLDPRSSEAWQVRAETLLHARRPDEAFAAARRGMDLAPGDPGALWLAARAANAARSPGEEAEILERLVALAKGRSGDAGFYQLYLGQAYARMGLARPAATALREAAAAPGLSDTQRRQISEQIAEIEASGGH